MGVRDLIAQLDAEKLREEQRRVEEARAAAEHTQQLQ
eukprot:gene7575-9850_t